MAVIAHVVLQGVTPEQYDALRAKVDWLTIPPSGGLAHMTWWEGLDCHSVDAWDGEYAFQSFSLDRLEPAMAELGIQGTPWVTFHPAHEVFLPYAHTYRAT